MSDFVRRITLTGAAAWFVAAWFTAALFAQAPPPEKCTMEGHVFDAATGAPLKKVQLSLRRVAGRNTTGLAATTDAAGHFSLTNIDAGQYRLWADRNGYVRQEYGARAQGRAGTLLNPQAGQRLNDLDIRLTPHSILTGTIVDEDAEPVAGANVQLVKYTYRNRRKQLTAAGYAQTNDLGEYRVYGVAPGRYYITAIYRQQSTGDQVYAPTYYPGTTDALSAAPLELAAGHQISGINFTLRKRPAVHLRGSIGRPGTVFLWAKNASIAEFNRNGARVRDKNGTFELRGVLPGSYILGMEFEDETTRYSARLPIEVGATDIDGIRLTPQPDRNLPGSVRIDGDAPATLGKMTVSLRADSGPGAGMTAAPVKDSAFTLESIAPGTYTVNVSGAPDGYYPKSVRFGDREVLDAPLDLSGGGGGALEVVLSAGGGQIDGVALGPKSQPAPSAIVVLTPELSRREQLYRYKTASTDTSGRFKLSGIPPGDYKVFAWDEADIEPGAYMDPDFLKTVEEQGRPFSIKENAHETVQLKLIPASGQSGSAAN